jgi:hypothetical protein
MLTRELLISGRDLTKARAFSSASKSEVDSWAQSTSPNVSPRRMMGREIHHSLVPPGIPRVKLPSEPIRYDATGGAA